MGMADSDAPCFDRELFKFLRELAANNERPWFNANKARYERHVKEPSLAFVEDMALRLPAVAPQLVADKRSLFRIYRDTRFSKDKTPYKTHVGIYLRHADAAQADTAGLYLHLAPREVFMGAGMWHPGSPALKRLRTAIVQRPGAWHAAVAGVAPDWELNDGDKLKRAPAGFAADHPEIEDLKRRSFAIVSRLKQGDATGRGFLDEFERRAAAARPFMAFMSNAVGVAY